MKTYGLNGTNWDTTLPILDTFHEEAEENDGILTDKVFEDVVEAYGADEEEVMEMMVNSNEYNFKRMLDKGWQVEKNE